uniref:Uncharacterized protein n=1 Tax=Anguilla anguilla TaxID=7936 RepID=A0A0E9V527_ANGAN
MKISLNTCYVQLNVFYPSAMSIKCLINTQPPAFSKCGCF